MILRRGTRVKPPIAYWGGKHYALTRIAYYLPERGAKFHTLLSPFCGGSSLEINAAAHGYHVRAFDMFEPVITFMRELTTKPDPLIQTILEIDPTTKAAWLKMREAYWSERDQTKRAAMYYCINNHSFSGLSFQDKSYCVPSRRLDQTHKLREYAERVKGRIHFGVADYTETLRGRKQNTVIYADPPYADLHEERYGRKRGGRFDHVRLKRCLDRHDYWLLSYADTDTIRDLYAGYVAVRPRYHWCTGRHEKTQGHLKPAEDLLIMSDKLAERNPPILPVRL